MFFYISDRKDSLAKYYPHLHKRYKIQRVSIRPKQPKSNRSNSNSKTSQSKSKDKNLQNMLTNRTKRQTIKSPNIYLSPNYCLENNKKINHMSNKSLSKSKESKFIQSNNLIKFNKIVSVKPADLKAK